LTTSLTLQFEVIRCSRVASLLLVSPMFGSYLQESQRRKKIGRDDFLMPSGIRVEEGRRKVYEEAVKQAYDAYSWMIDRGIEIEDARYILPLSSKTSLFACGSLETFMGLIVDARRLGRGSQYYPEELSIIGERVGEVAERVAPKLTEARLHFRIKLPSYPYANPYRRGDGPVEELIKRRGGEKPTLLGLNVLVDRAEVIRGILEDPAEAHVLNPLIHAIFLEPMSLAAYHQSIRHRTIPTAIESIYSAIDRCLSGQEGNLITPPSIMNLESFLKRFQEAASRLLEAYEALVEDGVRPSDAVYLIPQALRIYAIRSYNAFNLLWPQGYVAMRTCSYSQWEVRKLAYEVWRRIGEEVPWLDELMGERCKLLGYCPERRWCPIILKYVEYDDERHRKVLEGCSAKDGQP
ncbi:MAG: FAD-dependent thymidylate synthase, partial [Nitrososphaeria archaeon]|nr:FAD-dependent thymidylate synthase [Nitrososphaeria archaeon]